MRRSLPSRWRALMVLAIAALVALGIGAAHHGWKSVLYVLPIVLAIGIFAFVTSGRDTDYGAALRAEFDERQQLQRLKTQALVGRVLSIAVTFAYVVVLVAHAIVWPWAVLLALMAASFIGGRLLYGERGGDAREK